MSVHDMSENKKLLAEHGPQILQSLRQLPTTRLVSAMRAFEHAPRVSFRPEGDDACGCFLEAAGYTSSQYMGDDVPPYLSLAYESFNSWFQGECVRELAERGNAPENRPVQHLESVSR